MKAVDAFFLLTSDSEAHTSDANLESTSCSPGGVRAE